MRFEINIYLIYLLYREIYDLIFWKISRPVTADLREGSTAKLVLDTSKMVKYDTINIMLKYSGGKFSFQITWDGSRGGLLA